jgi:hypothetical protein
MSYLEHFITPASCCDTVVTATTSLFPRYSSFIYVDSCMYSFMMEPFSDPILGYDNRVVESRVKSFLIPRYEDNSLVRDDKFIAGIRACIVYLLSEILQQARTIPHGASLSRWICGTPHSIILNCETCLNIPDFPEGKQSGFSRSWIFSCHRACSSY